MRPTTSLSLLTIAIALLLSAAAAQDATSAQLDPSATCPYQLGDQIQACLAQVEADESRLPGGPCSTGQWSCICNKQQGLIDCWKPCPGVQPREDVQYNENNCAGQNNGVRNAAAGGTLTYSGSPITTTGSAGAASSTSAVSTTESSSSTSSRSSSSASSSRSASATASASGSASSSGTASIAAVSWMYVMASGLVVLAMAL